MNYYAPPIGNGAISIGFVCPSVRPSVCRSVAYKLGTRFPIFDATRIPVSRSKVKVTRSINADTHRAPYLPNGKAYELQTWYTNGRRRPASATDAMTSNVKGHGRKVT